MRIISGSLRGRKLSPLTGRDIRPTSDRTREAVFNILGPKVRNCRVLDLFAGTGALGIEALSRGAAQAFFIDLSCDMVKKNLELCSLSTKAEIHQMDLIRQDFPAFLFEAPFDLVFIDPPYHKGYLENVLTKKGFCDLLTQNAMVILEYSKKESLTFSLKGLDILKQKKYSKTKIAVLTKT